MDSAFGDFHSNKQPENLCRNLHSPQAFVSIDKTIVKYTDVEWANAAAILME